MKQFLTRKLRDFKDVWDHVPDEIQFCVLFTSVIATLLVIGIQFGYSTSNWKEQQEHIRAIETKKIDAQIKMESLQMARDIGTLKSEAAAMLLDLKKNDQEESTPKPIDVEVLSNN